MTTLEESINPAAVGPARGDGMNERELTTHDLSAIREHVCGPQMGALLQRMDAGFERLETKLDRRLDAAETDVAALKQRQDATDADVSNLKRVAGRALFVYGLLALGAGSMIGMVWEWLKRKLGWQ